MLEKEYFWILIYIVYIFVVKCLGDEHGTVNVGHCIVSPNTNKTDTSSRLISVTENVASSVLPVYFLLRNNSVQLLDECLILEEEVLVSCTAKNNYTNGDSVVEFVDARISVGQAIGNIPYSIIQQGRAIDVECSGTTVSTPGLLPPMFASNTSIGVIGAVVVKKSPVVSLCDDVVIVPNAIAITTGQIHLELSEPVADDNVTVSCEITGIAQDVNGSQVWVPVDEADDSLWMYLVFRDVQATIGTTEILMTYDIFRRGSLVLVTCFVESANNGTQFLRNTSASTPTLFVLDTGSVQLLPRISLVHQPSFTAFVVLSSAMMANEVEVVYSCYLTAVNDSLEAREIAENPVCNTTDDVFNRPSANSHASTSGCTPGVNTTCSPVTSPTATPNITQGKWVLEESELFFTEGDVYKPIRAQLHSASAIYQGALVLTCCAAPDINTSPRLTNTSAALLILSDVNGYRPFNWTKASVSTTMETVFANPAYVEMSPCPCNLAHNHCDTDCCCDQDCTKDDLATFTCITDVKGGDYNITSTFSCYNTALFKPDFWPFLCVQISNSPHLGLYYSSVAGVRDLATFNSRKAAFTDNSLTSFRDLGKRMLEHVDDENSVTVRLYKNGHPVKQLYSEDVRGYLSLPHRVPGSDCLWTSPLKYQNDFESTCEFTPDQKLCAEKSQLSAQMYLQGSTSSYPACPDPPRVVSKYRSRLVAPTDVAYYCTEDVTPYLVSTMTTDDALNPNIPSLFPDEEDANPAPVAPRCSWDDGYTRPPVPVYDADNRLCHNSVLDVKYNLYWRGGKIVAVEANLILGSIELMPSVQIQGDEEEEIDFVSPPPITAPPATTEELRTTSWYTTNTLENDTEIKTLSNSTDIYQNYTIPTGTIATIGTNGTTGMYGTTPNTSPPSTPKATTTNPPTTPVPTTTSTPTDAPDPTGLPTPPVMSPTPTGTASTSAPSSQRSTETIAYAFVQYFSAKFIHLPQSVVDYDTGFVIEPEPQYERSGNPGYVIGSRVLTGVKVFDYLPDYDYECLENSTDYDNCSLPTPPQGPNGTFVMVDDSEEKRLKVWAPGPSSLCSDASTIDVPFGEDLISGCLLRLGLAELQNCSILREILREQLISLVPSDTIGKTGNANVAIAEGWAPIFGLDDEPYDSVNITSSPGDPGTTAVPLTTRFPGQRYVQDPTPTQLAEQLSGVCYDMPTVINIEILIADAGLNRGTVQQEILGARVTLTNSKLQLQCSAASGASCLVYNNPLPGNESAPTQWVQSFLVSSTIKYTKVPAVEPEPVLLYKLGKKEGLCRRDACWQESLHPFTKAFQGDTFQYTLGVTFLTLFFSIGYIAVTQPWLKLP